MPELLPQAMGWWDAQKHAIAAQIATAMAAPETIGPNLWSALKDFGGNLGVSQDSGDPAQNSRNAMSGFGVGSVHPFGPRGPKPPAAPTLGGGLLDQFAAARRGAAAGFTPEELARMQAAEARMAARPVDITGMRSLQIARDQAPPPSYDVLESPLTPEMMRLFKMLPKLVE